ncbi:hypothetical protein NM688_g8767 [Phlebia brevispora]|uniref:Uncharacterized protein n=1 Tax=Phlebia brevispora TaxID=194682 RepID=A0ACC1RSK3_9APHY|nr:hypothetical protein NM688_g8767 [Phlebia brevispora]
MRRTGLVDPAYAYALHKNNFHPRPQGRTLDKKYLKTRQTAWNSAVDEYIELGIDKRPRSVIERGAKVGLSLGALYRVCENPECGKVEGDGHTTLRVCSKCKISVFCSTACQAKMWPQHKEECGSPHHREQLLLSQHNLFEGARPVVAAKFNELFAKMDRSRKDFPGARILRQCIAHFENNERLSPDLLDIADRFRDALLELRNETIHLSDLSHMPRAT